LTFANPRGDAILFVFLFDAPRNKKEHDQECSRNNDAYGAHREIAKLGNQLYCNPKGQRGNEKKGGYEQLSFRGPLLRNEVRLGSPDLP
jgi:hypothetical protein